MKTLIIYKSYHRMNTEKIAREMAKALNATLAKVEDVRAGDPDSYDLLGFGSGIYGGKHHRTLFDLIEKMNVKGKNAFIFSTSGVMAEYQHQPLRDLLTVKGCRIISDFQCPGEVTPLGFNMNLKGALGWLAGKNKGHPDEKDLENARIFARELISA